MLTSPGSWTCVKFQEISEHFCYRGYYPKCMYELRCSVIVVINCLLHTAGRVWFGLRDKYEGVCVCMYLCPVYHCSVIFS
jgi:hypothetical protein